jgi:hypothetical protein
MSLGARYTPEMYTIDVNSEIEQNSVGPEIKKILCDYFPKIWGLVVFSSRPDFRSDHWIPHEQLGSKWP